MKSSDKSGGFFLLASVCITFKNSDMSYISEFKRRIVMSKFDNVEIGPITKAILKSGVTTCTHNHPGGSLFDAVDEVKKYIEAALNAGYKNFAVTDHASFSAMQTAIDTAQVINKEVKEGKRKNGINIIYGVEAYIEVPPFRIEDRVGHMILMAVNERGKHLIDKLNSHASASRNGKPVMTVADLKKVNFNSDVIATSACISGAAALQLLANDLFDKMAEKERRAQKRIAEKDDKTEAVCISPDNKEYIGLKIKTEQSLKKLNETIAIRDNSELKERCKIIAQNIRDLKKKNEMGNTILKIDELVKEYEKINNIMMNAKEDVPKLRKIYNSNKSALKEIQEKVDKWIAHENKANEYLQMKKSNGELIKAAEKSMLFYQNLFGAGNYYIEVQYHGLEDEKRVYPTLAKLAKKNNIPILAANDAHMADNSVKSIDMRNVAKFLRFTNVSETDADKELYVKTPYELAQALSVILPDNLVAESLNNLNIVGERCAYVPCKTTHYPVFDKNKNSNELLRQEAEKGILWRYPDYKGWDKTHQERMEYELSIIIQMGFADYHLIVKDFLEYARICGKIPIDKLDEAPLNIEGVKRYVKEHGYNTGIGVGAGRGSGAGSLVTYLLGITDIDPFKYGLIFERFLNPERISMPDIDSDFAYGVREKTIEYVRNKYGSDAVVGIITESRQQAKGAIRDAARYYAKKMYNDDKKFLNLSNEIRKKVPVGATNFKDIVGMKETGRFDELYIPIEEEVSLISMLKDEYKDNKDAIAILEIASHCEGMLTAYGQHAAGVIIYDGEDITDYIPVRDGKLGIRTTEMDMIQCEDNKLLKMDFLGLKTLSVITETIRMIERDTGEVINMEDIPLEGERADAVYREVYAKGRTRNVFQFESAGMRQNLKKLFA